MKRVIADNFLVCDEARREDNGKLLLVGIYTPDIVVKELPVILPGLCFFFTVRGLIPQKNQGVTLRLYAPSKAQLGERHFGIGEEEKTSRAYIIFRIMPFPIKDAGAYTLKLEFVTGQTLKKTFRVILQEEPS